MAQVFVPSVGLNLQQGQASRGARIDTSIPMQVNPTDSLKPLNKLLDTVSNDLGKWDTMNVQRDALESFDNLQQQLSANRDEFLNKKGKEAIDFAKTYEKNNKDTFAKAMDNISDFRVRNAVHENAKRMYDGYVNNGNTYLAQQTAAANLNQAKATLQNAANNYIDQHVNGDPQQQADANAQFIYAINNHAKLTGIDPDGIDGEQERKKNYDAIYEAMNKHYLSHKAFVTANQTLDAAKAKMNYQTYLKEKDKIYLKEEAEKTLNAASGSSFKLPDRASWVKVRAEDMVNAEEADILKTNPDLIKQNPNWRQERMQYALFQANKQFDDLELKNKAASDTDSAMNNMVSTAYNYATANGKVWSANGQGATVSADVLNDPTNVLGRLPAEIQQHAIAKYGTAQKANEELYKLVLPPQSVTAGNGVQMVADFQRDPTGFYDKYHSETELRADLFRNGVGADDTQAIVKAYTSEQAKEEQVQINNIEKDVISLGGFSSDLADDKKIKADHMLARKREVLNKAVAKSYRALKKINPNLSELDLTPKVVATVLADKQIQEKMTAIDNLADKTDAYREFSETLNSYDKSLLDAVQAFDPRGYEACFTGDPVVGANRLEKLIETTTANKNFQNRHPQMKEVKRQILKEDEEKRRSQTENSFQDALNVVGTY